MERLRRSFCQCIVSLLLVFMAVTIADAGEFWAKKAYQSWSADETRDMLAESPWATTVTLGGFS